MTRSTWDQTWLAVAAAVAQRSRCVRFRTGTVIVDPRNRIVATGYIGPAAKWWKLVDDEPIPSENGLCHEFCDRGAHGPTDETRLSYSDCVSIHSELNALLVCDRADREGGTIYVTSVPCWTCAKAIANSGLKRAVIVDTQDQHQYRSPHNSLTHLLQSSITVDLIQA